MFPENQAPQANNKHEKLRERGQLLAELGHLTAQKRDSIKTDTEPGEE